MGCGVGGESSATSIELGSLSRKASYVRAALHRRGRERNFESLSCFVLRLCVAATQARPLLIPVSSNPDKQAVPFCTNHNLQGRPVLTFAVVTTAPSQWMARIHNRMPVILQDDQIDTWLDPTISDAQNLNELLKAPPEDFLDCYPVSREMNSVRADLAESAERVDVDYSALLKTPE
jgi:SOS response associated peptidase (SRAP)